MEGDYSIERLKDMFVSRKEFEDMKESYNIHKSNVEKALLKASAETDKKLSEINTQLAEVKQKIDTISWLTKTALATILGGVIVAVMGVILK